MHTNNLEKLSAQAKDFVEFFICNPQISKTITATSDFYILDPLEMRRIDNVIKIFDELKENGNIKDYLINRIKGRLSIKGKSVFFSLCGRRSE